MVPLPLLVLAATSARANCPATTATLRADVDTALAACDDWDWARFEEATRAARADLACLAEPVSPELARDLHVIVAFHAFRAHDTALMASALRAARAVDSTWRPTVDQAAPGSQLYAAYEAAAEATGGASLSLDGAEDWFVDGRTAGDAIPLGRCAVVQHLSAAGLENWYLSGGAAPVDLLARLAPPAVAGAGDPPVPERRLPGERRRRAVVWTVGVGAGLVSAGSLALARHWDQVYQEAESRDEASRAWRANYFWGLTGYTAGALAGGVAVGAVLKKRF